MSGFLIDTNVLSEYNRPGGPDAGVKRWLETTDRESQHVRASAALTSNSGSSKTSKRGCRAYP
jgi:hypothetical protein